MSLRLGSSFLVLLGVLNAVCPDLSAQPLAERWSLRGRVTSADNQPIAGAKVTIARKETKVKAGYWGGEVFTNKAGEFALPGVEAGTYAVRIAARGFYRDLLPPQREDESEFKFLSPQQRLNITLKRVVPLRILRPDGQPLANTDVLVMTGSRELAETQTVREYAPIAPEKVAELLKGLKFDTPAVIEIKEPFRVSDPQSLRTDAQGYIIPDLNPHTSVSVVVVARGLGAACVRKANFKEGNPAVEARLEPTGTLRTIVREKSSAADTNKNGPLLGSAWPPLESQGVIGDWRMSEVAPSVGNFYWETGSYANMGAIRQMATATIDGGGYAEITDLLPGNYGIRMALQGYRESYAERVEVEAGKTTVVEIYLEREKPQAPLDIRIINALGVPVANKEFFIRVDPSGDKNENGWILRGSYYRRGWTDARGHIVLYPVQVGKWNISVYQPRDDFNSIERPVAIGGASEVNVEPTGSALTIKLSSQP